MRASGDRGGRVISLPASAATVQGYTGHVVIDEAAWIPDVDALWMAVVPTISTRTEYRLSVVSTPGPRAGMFHRLWNNGDEAWSRHRVSIYDARAGGPAQRVGFGPCGKRNGGSQLLCAGK